MIRLDLQYSCVVYRKPVLLAANYLRQKRIAEDASDEGDAAEPAKQQSHRRRKKKAATKKSSEQTKESSEAAAKDPAKDPDSSLVEDTRNMEELMRRCENQEESMYYRPYVCVMVYTYVHVYHVIILYKY